MTKNNKYKHFKALSRGAKEAEVEELGSRMRMRRRSRVRK